MKIQDTEKALTESAFWKEEVSIHMQPGWPWLEAEGQKLYIVYKPYRQELTGSEVLFYAPAYRIETVYPFKHIAEYENIAVKYPDSIKVAGRCPVDWLLSEGKQKLEELYAACNYVLGLWEDGSNNTVEKIKEYQKLYTAVWKLFYANQ